MSSTATTKQAAKSAAHEHAHTRGDAAKRGESMFARARAWHPQSTLAVALVGSVLMWAALPPLGWGWLGWFAPIPWLILVSVDELPGRRPYRALYLAGVAFWLMTIQWLRLPHPATYLGWFALSAYLGCYLPVFVGLSRVAVHRLRVPPWIAAPVVWTGLELARAHLLTGFLLASLAHTQVHWVAMIQLSDLVGEYGVDFVVMVVACCITKAVRTVTRGSRSDLETSQSRRQRKRLKTETGMRRYASALRALVPAAVAVGATLLYGHWRLGDFQRAPVGADEVKRGPRIALIQGNSLAEWKADPNRERQIMEEYVRLSDEAVVKARRTGDGRPADLVVWPETMFRSPLIAYDPDYKVSANAAHSPKEIAAYGPHDLAALAKRLDTPVLVGLDRMHFAAAPEPGAAQPPAKRYNCAALVARDGKIVGTYDKNHRVMFGEYIPFAELLPFLYRVTPLTGSIVAGSEPVALSFGDSYSVMPTICYETVIPHEIRRQVATLKAGGATPDALVNLTNDAWYWGSSELDMHLACGVFRAVESRLPLVIAANGGISAWIDEYGRVRARSPRRKAEVLFADVERSSLQSAYVRFGDWFAGLCLACCIALAVVGWRWRRQELHSSTLQVSPS